MSEDLNIPAEAEDRWRDALKEASRALDEMSFQERVKLQSDELTKYGAWVTGYAAALMKEARARGDGGEGGVFVVYSTHVKCVDCSLTWPGANGNDARKHAHDSGGHKVLLTQTMVSEFSLKEQS